MPEFDRSTLAIVGDIRDREQASDGHSRYGAYLAKSAECFHYDGEPLPAAQFAVIAWRTATTPVMAPGYVAVRPDLLDLAPVVGPDGDLHLRARLALRHHHLTHRPAVRLTDWERNPWHAHDRWPVPMEPDHADRPALLVTADVSVPVPVNLFAGPSTARPGRTLTHEAKAVVDTLVRRANQRLAPLVADLLGD
ncbi:hypothetical protein OG401_21915 [Kitasatospora purpeofusca]|uniref:hypothetical protein n=1 Tax=Kitasatospora purpeofusca TaxID=67352 RepID=UPI00225A0F2C|nr:hypothetical protein [Kitasatospora purpeofusca]MCX4686929.1 hypothetical protein [Kitasatospora purpeofusca]